MGLPTFYKQRGDCMASLRFYTDSALTQTAFDVPIGSATWALHKANLSTFTEGGETYYYYNGSDYGMDFSNVSADGMSIENLDYHSTVYSDGLAVTEFYNQPEPGAFIVGSWYSRGHMVRGSSGTHNRNALAVRFDCDGIPMVAIGNTYTEWGQRKFASYVIVSENCLGAKAFTHPYMDESHGLNDGNGESWGGTGTTTHDSDNVTFPAIHTKVTPFNLTAGAGTHVYIIDDTAFDSFTGYLWGTTQSVFDDVWQKWQNYKFNPIGAILGCYALPSAFMPPLAERQTVNQIYLAGTTLAPIAANCWGLLPTAHQFIQYPTTENMEYVSLDSLIDFQDFTGVDVVVHVPFCGQCVVPISAVMGGVSDDGTTYNAGGIAVTYFADIMTGNVCAFVMGKDRNGNTACLQTLTGNAAYNVPITGNDNGTGQMFGALASTALGAVTGNIGAVAAGVATLGLDTAQRTTSIIGNHGGSAAILTNLYCYAEISYTNYSNPANYSDVRGRPSDLGGTVSEQNGIAYSGLTIFENAHVHDIRCTPEERAEIEMLLKEGVYL